MLEDKEVKNMPSRDKQKPRRYYRISGDNFTMFRIGLYTRQKKFLEDYSARLGCCMSAIVREGLDLLIEKWCADPRFKPGIDNSDRGWFNELISTLDAEREKETDKELEEFDKELKEEGIKRMKD